MIQQGSECGDTEGKKDAEQRAVCRVRVPRSTRVGAAAVFARGRVRGLHAGKLGCSRFTHHFVDGTFAVVVDVGVAVLVIRPRSAVLVLLPRVAVLVLLPLTCCSRRSRSTA